MKPVQLLAVFAENKPDQLARISRELADASVNIHWVGIADVQKFGVIRFLVDKCDLAYQWLKQHDFTISLVEVLAVEVEDRPGGLADILRVLASDKVNVEYMYGFVEKSGGKALMVFRFEEPERAIEALTRNKLKVIGPTDIVSL